MKNGIDIKISVTSNGFLVAPQCMDPHIYIGPKECATFETVGSMLIWLNEHFAPPEEKVDQP